MEKDEEENSFERNDLGARLEYYFSTKKINPF